MANKKKEEVRYTPLKIKYIPLDAIAEPRLPQRISINDTRVKALAESIKQVGQLQPIGLVKQGDKYEISWGHRRYLAMQQLRSADIAAVIVDMDLKDNLLARAHENIHHEPISTFEEANYYQSCLEALDISQKDLARSMGVSEGYISQRLNIFEWPPELQAALRDEKISFSVGRILKVMAGSIELGSYLAQAIQDEAAPATVQRWVDLWKSYQQPERPENNNEQESYRPSVVEPQTYTCFFCREGMDFQDARNIWAHNACVRSIVELILGVDREADNAPPSQLAE